MRNQTIHIGVKMKNTSFAFLMIFFAWIPATSSGQTEQAADPSGQDPPIPEVIDFNRDIRPILNEHCTACHGGVKQAADVSFVYRNQVVAPEGWVVEPGDPDSSEMIVRVLSTDPEDQMPPPEHGPRLEERQVKLLTKWIKDGAKWGQHWAYQTPQAPPKPIVENTQWPRQSLDAFVLKSLEQRNIKPAPESDADRWLRRTTLDLTGLPPTLADRESFLLEVSQAKASAPDQVDKVYEKVVDRLLNSPSYGERWASVWLDQIRYADSKGLGLDGRRNIWKYRDWVIDAMNDDMPFDQFTIKQLAGDLVQDRTIDDLIATAAHRVTQTNEEGGTDDEEFRVAAVLDRVNTTWQAWQGITFGCVQCHSHPYDPFKHEEYYQFAAFFNNTADSDLGEEWPTIRAPIDRKDYARATELDDQIKAINFQVWQTEYAQLQNDVWQPLRDYRASTNNDTKIEAVDVDGNFEFHTIDTVSNGTAIIVESPLPEDLSKLTAIRLTVLPMDELKAKADSEWGFAISHIKAELILPDQKDPIAIEFSRVIGDEPEPFFNPQDSLNEKTNRGFAAYSRIFGARQAAFILKTPVEIPADAKLKIQLRNNVVALGAFPLVSRRGRLAVSGEESFNRLASNSELEGLRKKIADIKKARNDIESTSLPVLAERPDHLARPTHVFIRGLFLTKGDQVQANTPESLPKLGDVEEIDRLALANWMVSKENPLTARVAVNRIWARLFGVGIVATEEDFGSSGEPPSHPQLLDHLAIRFQDDYQWSQKKLIREIVLSSTYRQSSKIRPEYLEADSNNRWLARGPRHRLSAEVVRDQALAVSGLLNDRLHGPPVHPPIPPGVWRPFSGGDKWNTPKPESGDRYRRSIYTYTKRSIPYPMFAAFDAPSREICSSRRLRSNTPIQALTMLNDQTFQECTTAFAKRLKGFEGDLNAKLEKAFIAVTCREPSEGEVADLRMLFDAFDASEKERAYQSVASVLLNLDEVVTK